MGVAAADLNGDGRDDLAPLAPGCYSLMIELDSGQLLAAWFRLS